MAITPQNQRSNGQRRRRLRARFGEEGVDVDGAQLSAREPERGWGPGVSNSLGASARERERENPGGLAGLVSQLGQNSSASPFPFLYSFSFSNLIFWNDFQMNSNSI